MRLPILLILIVVTTLPADVHSLVADVATQYRATSGMLGEMLDRNDEPATTKVAALR